MPKRCSERQDAPQKLHADDAEAVLDDVSPLLTLEPSRTENTGENSMGSEDSDQPAMLGPLLGTSAPKRR